MSGFGPGRLRGLRGLIDAMKMDVAGKAENIYIYIICVCIYINFKKCVYIYNNM